MAIMRDVPILPVVSASVQQSKILNKLCNGEEVRFVLNGAENLHKVHTYTLATNHQIYVTKSMIVAKNLTVWVGLCGNGDMLGPFYDGSVN